MASFYLKLRFSVILKTVSTSVVEISWYKIKLIWCLFWWLWCLIFNSLPSTISLKQSNGSCNADSIRNNLLISTKGIQLHKHFINFFIHKRKTSSLLLMTKESKWFKTCIKNYSNEFYIFQDIDTWPLTRKSLCCNLVKDEFIKILWISFMNALGYSSTKFYSQNLFIGEVFSL